MVVESNADKLVRCTVMIEAVVEGVPIGTGSGLLMQLKPFGSADPRVVAVVVTNKHVVEGADQIRYSLAMGKPGSRIVSTSVASSIMHHPDPEVDLCLVPVADAAMQKGVHQHTFISSDDIFNSTRLAELTSIESILMIGYPNGILDQQGLYPIARRGITATPAFADFDGQPIFMIDCACFPGSSGSPVFIFDPQGYVDKRNDIQLGIVRFGILGFLFAGPVMNQIGEIIPEKPPSNLKSMVEVPLMLNLGFCVRAEKLFDFFPLLIKFLT